MSENRFENRFEDFFFRYVQKKKNLEKLQDSSLCVCVCMCVYERYSYYVLLVRLYVYISNRERKSVQESFRGRLLVIFEKKKLEELQDSPLCVCVYMRDILIMSFL